MEAQAISKAPKQIGIDTIILLADKGHSNGEIAKIVGCSAQNIQARLANYDYNGFKTFRERKDSVFERIQHELAESLNADDLKKMQARDRITGIAILEDKIRLIRGQATEISVNFDALKAMQARQRELADKIRALEHGEVIEIEPGPQDVVSTPSDNDAPNHNYAESLSVPNKRASDNSNYVNHAEGKGKSQGARRGRPRKGR